MKYLLLLPGSLAVALSNRYPSSPWAVLAAPLPTSYVGLRAIEGKQLFVFLSLIILCFFLGVGLRSCGLDAIALLLSFWHVSTALAATNTERHVIHSTLATALFLSLFPWNSSPLPLAALHLFLIAGWLFMGLPQDMAPAWCRAKTPLGLLPLTAILWFLPSAPELVLGSLAALGLTLWSSYALTRSLALKH